MKKLILLLMLGLGPWTLDIFALAFPTAEGYGKDSIGGRGGTLIEVTNLNDSGAGSFRAALMQTVPRIIVFRVGGTISLTSLISPGTAQSFVTIAGQTAPGGIQLAGQGIRFHEGIHDVIIRHMRIRPGNLVANVDPSGIIVYGDTGTPDKIIIDHCSLEWGVDENMDYAQTVTNQTIQWSIMARGTTTGHIKGANHGFGLLAGYSTTSTISIHHNLFAHNQGRNPYIEQAGTVDLVNNVIYNWGGNNGSLYLGGCEDSQCLAGQRYAAHANWVNNVAIKGVDSSTQTYIGWVRRKVEGTRIYTSGNYGPSCPTGCANDWNNLFRDADALPSTTMATEADYRVGTPYSTPAITTAETSTVKSLVLASVGATVPLRDSLDTSIVSEATNGTGSIGTINPIAIGSWPTLGVGTAPTDTDHDGMPNTWETTHGLNPNNAADGQTISTGGYSNVELYLNELVGEVMAAPPISTIVLVPNGGENFIAGTPVTLSWTTNSTSNAKIEISRDSGTSYPETIVASFAQISGTNTYSWTPTSPRTTTARIKITDLTSLTFGDSDTDFIIRGVFVK